jgi:peptide/nickel transport system ATP-binding protein
MTLLELRDVRRTYRIRRGLWGGTEEVRAVNGVSLTLERGRILGLVGESGCGKSTTGRLALSLEQPDMGDVLFEGALIPNEKTPAWRALRRRMQLVFQDPLGAMDRRLTIGKQVAEPLIIHGIGSKEERQQRVDHLLQVTGLRPDQGASYPHELSGGQRQRAVIARALATNPDLLVCDEPVSALDVSIQAQVVNLLTDLQRELGLAILFISHDLKLVGTISDEVAIMYLGQIIERGSPKAIYESPAHPYTQALLGAVPDPTRRGQRQLLTGEPPNPAARPSGCSFHPRCPLAQSQCAEVEPGLKNFSDGRVVACHLADPESIPQAELACKRERASSC